MMIVILFLIWHVLYVTLLQTKKIKNHYSAKLHNVNALAWGEGISKTNSSWRDGEVECKQGRDSGRAGRKVATCSRVSIRRCIDHLNK